MDKVRPVESVQEWWEETNMTILRVVQEVLSITAGRTPPGDKDTWWWNDKVQEVLSITAVRRPPGDKDTWWWNDKVQEVITAKTTWAKMMVYHMESAGMR